MREEKISMFRWKKKPNGSSILPFGLFNILLLSSIQYDQNLTLYQTMSDLVANPAIQGAELLVPKAVFLRPYVWPFSIIYPIFLQIYFQQYDKYIGGKEWTLYTPLLLFL